jgi:ABC-type Fe3+-siderophore transport system permease subunit
VFFFLLLLFQFDRQRFILLFAQDISRTLGVRVTRIRIVRIESAGVVPASPPFFNQARFCAFLLGLFV